MNFKLLLIIWPVFLYFMPIAEGQRLPSKRIVCFYDISTGKYQGEPFYFAKKSLSQALAYCSHLIYSFAEIPSHAFIIRKFIINPYPDVLKKQFPHLKIFLGVGSDQIKDTDQYMKFLKAGEVKQTFFAKYIRTFLKFNNFDGLDLAFPFPQNEPHRIQSQFTTAVIKLKKLISSDKNTKTESNILKLKYTKFVHLLKRTFSTTKLQLSMTVLPNINSTLFFDVFKIHTNFEFINLLAFDFLTPTRNPTEADYTAPIYLKKEAHRYPHNSIDFQVNHWINNGCPVNKLNLGIATYGRAWNLTIDSGLSGKPVVENTNGAAAPGKYSKIAGLLSWPEICTKLTIKGFLRKVTDNEFKYGNYAFNPADKNNKNGIWISFDDPYFAGVKSEYVKEKLMGGVAVYNLQNDDFQQFCKGTKFPILSRIREVLGTI